MFNLNAVQLAGHVTRDVQSRQIGPDNQVANFGLAINRRYKKGDEMMEEVTFLDIECWSKLAEIVSQYVSKGSPVYVSGRIKLDSWTTDAGEKRSKLKVVADSVQFLGQRKDADDTAPAGAIGHTARKPVDTRAQAAGGSRTPPTAGHEEQPPFQKLGEHE